MKVIAILADYDIDVARLNAEARSVNYPTYLYLRDIILAGDIVRLIRRGDLKPSPFMS
ncbi:MAG: hypothetical protein GQ565_11140 [Candidatus Aegiribacteria sp.]|nr:hypothetical protein [Candidatus Aegiribacteria sp.]